MKVAIASGKGGTGKTTLSVNLAAYMSEVSLSSGGVVLADLDAEEPNSGLFLSGPVVHQEEIVRMVPSWKKENCTSCGLCRSVCNFHAVIKLGPQVMIFPELCHSCYACSELCPSEALPMVPVRIGVLKHSRANSDSVPFSFVEGRLDIGQEQAVPVIARTLAYAEKAFPKGSLKILDCPPGTSCPVIESIKDADLVILVTEPTPIGQHDLKLAVATVRSLAKPLGVIINRDGLGNRDTEDYCRREGIGIIAKIRNNRKIAELYSGGRLIYTELPEVLQELGKTAEFIRRAAGERIL